MKDEPAEDIEALTGTVRRFTLERIAPHVAGWEAAGEVPRGLYREARVARAARPGLSGSARRHARALCAAQRGVHHDVAPRGQRGRDGRLFR